MALIRILNDDSLMPFGKHKGKKMADVPADYLLWFRDTEPLPEYGKVQIGNITYDGVPADRIRAEQKAVRLYTEDCLNVLKAEQKRGRQGKRNCLFNPYR